MQLRSLFGALALAFSIIMFIPSQTLAKGSHDKGSSCHKSYSKKSSHTSKHSYKKCSAHKSKKEHTRKSWCKKSKKAKKKTSHHKKYTWKTWCQTDKGSKGSCDKGSKGSSDKDSKGSCDKGSKGSSDKGSKGSCDKGSKGSSDKGSKGSSDKGSKGSSDKDSDGSLESTPTPVTTGSLTGTVYEDSNNNGSLDNNETGVAHIAIEIIDANGDIHNLLTDNVGNYTISNLPEGVATVTIDPTTLPALATLTVGLNPSDEVVVANTVSQATLDGYIIPVAVGDIHGQVLVSGQGYAGITLNITDIDGTVHPVVTDNNGNWILTGIIVGDAIVDVDETTLPGGVVRSIGLDQDVFTILENQDTDAGIDGYIVYVP